MSPIIKRILCGVGANVFGQIITTIIQLLSVPIFLHYWDAEKYGAWLMLSAVPAYFSMADIGLVAVAANRMTILTSKGEHSESNRVFQSAMVMTLLMIAAFSIVAIVFILISSLETFFSYNVKFALLILIAVALENVFSGLFDAIFRANNQYAKGVYALNFARITEWCVGLVFLCFGQGFLGVSIGLLIGRSMSLCAIWLYVNKYFKNFVWGKSDANWAEVKNLMRPAIAFMAFPLGNAISIQGMSLVVGTFFGPAFLAMFNTYRTLSRILVQLITTVSRSVWPEISRLYGAGDYSKIRKLSRLGTLILGSASIFLAFVIYKSAPWIISEWTHNKIPYDSSLLSLFLITTVTTSFWQLAMVITMATNTHEKLSYCYLSASVLVILIAIVLQNEFGNKSSVISLFVFEVIMFFSSYYVSSHVLKGD